MRPDERLAFSAIEGRPPLKLPGGLRLIVWPLMSLEHWDISRPMARMVITPPQGQPMLPDHPNWSWHEYGMRVGFWRLKRVFERLNVTPTVTLNGRVCETCPEVVRAAADAGWELNAHGYEQMPMHKLDDQRRAVPLPTSPTRQAIRSSWTPSTRGSTSARGSSSPSLASISWSR
jgi:hypothetical protein